MLYFIFENASNKPVRFRSNGGVDLRLAPRATSSEIAEIQISNNPKIQKLMDLGSLIRHEVKEKKESSAGLKAKEAKPQESKRKPTGKKTTI